MQFSSSGILNTIKCNLRKSLYWNKKSTIYCKAFKKQVEQDIINGITQFLKWQMHRERPLKREKFVDPGVFGHCLSCYVMLGLSCPVCVMNPCTFTAGVLSLASCLEQGNGLREMQRLGSRVVNSRIWVLTCPGLHRGSVPAPAVSGGWHFLPFSFCIYTLSHFFTMNICWLNNK